jgi:hypothetical protein
LGHKGPHSADSIGAAWLMGSPEQGFPFLDCAGKSMVGCVYGVAWRHNTQSLIPLSSLGHCSRVDSIVQSRSVKALGQHRVCGVVFTQCRVHGDDGEPRRGGVGLIRLTRLQQWDPSTITPTHPMVLGSLLSNLQSFALVPVFAPALEQCQHSHEGSPPHQGYLGRFCSCGESAARSPSGSDA